MNRDPDPTGDADPRRRRGATACDGDPGYHLDHAVATWTPCSTGLSRGPWNGVLLWSDGDVGRVHHRGGSISKPTQTGDKREKINVGCTRIVRACLHPVSRRMDLNSMSPSRCACPFCAWRLHDDFRAMRIRTPVGEFSGGRFGIVGMVYLHVWRARCWEGVVKMWKDRKEMWNEREKECSRSMNRCTLPL